MTKAESLRQELTDSGIVILDCPNMDRLSVVSPDGYIGISSIESSALEHSVLAHDRWHFRLGAFYKVYSPFCIREQMEYRVKKRALMETVPPDTLCTMLASGDDLSEIAEELEVPQEDVLQAFLLYKDLGLLPAC